MSTIHLFNIESLKSKFQDIIQTQYEILNKRSTLMNKIEDLKKIYSEMVKNNSKKIFLFCLDSFYFQYKTLIVEMDNINRFISMINNRVYGDYYKLYNIIISQTSTMNISNIQDIFNQFKKYIPYKDLEPFHEYKITDIIELHGDILRIINHLYAHYLSKEHDILDYTEHISSGISVGNFMQTLCYENTLFREQIILYVNYLSFFHDSQSKHLNKLFLRVNSFYTEIEEDILNNGRSISKTNQDNINELKQYMDSNSIKRKEFINSTIKSISNEDVSVSSMNEIVVSNENISIMIEEPIKNIHITKKEEVPVKKEEVPVKKEEVPVKKQEVPIKKEEVPVKKEEVPVKK